MKKSLIICTILAISSAFLGISCRRNTVVPSIKRDDLFSLKYGNFENQLNLFDLSETGNLINTSIAMKNGFFYISNGESKKILEMNSYGDLLSLYYNSQKNPSPLFNSSNINTVGNQLKNQEISTKKIIDYPLNNPSHICVDSKQLIYVVELFPEQQFETDNNRTLRQIVLRFDGNQCIGHIGQQGPGGTPFPFIKNIYTTSNNELVVICIVPEGIEVYWFSESGYPMHNILINSNDAPNPLSDKSDLNTFLKVENVIPDSKDGRLFVKIDYFNSVIDETSKVQSGIEYNSTYIYPLDVVTGKYGRPISIPAYEEVITQGFSKQIYKNPYDFLGVSGNNWMFFTIPTENGYVVQIVDPSSGKVIKRLLQFDKEKVVYHNFYLSGEGIISALLASKDKAEIVWWRTDTLIAALLKS
ncbi:MAG: hypothetical protein J6Y36_04720 [Treponema sp.]|uniref:LIC_12708 family protein n=1 Tax=Treponema sp. TaxID=166 RepID=UPI001B5F076D|nr:hypothetical protein [Treponema sp.]MBP5402444.1 hypothetical protein [Treponema sp.]MBR5933289.1 hypothetical protein [Treponema sp.]